MTARSALAVLLSVCFAAVVAGCAGGPVGPSTAPVSDGTEVSAQRYLADADAAATALGDFSEQLERIGPVARPAVLREVAPDLAVVLQRANAVVERLESQRLADARLESQRERAVPRLRDALTAMLAVTTRAAAGEPRPVVAAVRDFRDAVERLRELGAPGA